MNPSKISLPKNFPLPLSLPQEVGEKKKGDSIFSLSLDGRG